MRLLELYSLLCFVFLFLTYIYVWTYPRACLIFLPCSVKFYLIDFQQFRFVHPYHAWLTAVMSCCQHCLSREMDEWTRGCRERERKSKNGDRKGRRASPIRSLRASWKLSFGLGPSTVIELSWSFISFRLCDSRQKSDHHCSAWLAMAYTHKVHTHKQPQA